MAGGSGFRKDYTRGEKTLAQVTYHFHGSKGPPPDDDVPGTILLYDNGRSRTRFRAHVIGGTSGNSLLRLPVFCLAGMVFTANLAADWRAIPVSYPSKTNSQNT
jgi:hypothetical protein